MSIVTFGEVMGRLTPPGPLRLQQALPGSLNVTFAGAEANVAASLAMLGAEAAVVTALPRNVLGDACLASLRARGIDAESARKMIIRAFANETILEVPIAELREQLETVMLERLHEDRLATSGT